MRVNLKSRLGVLVCAVVFMAAFWVVARAQGGGNGSIPTWFNYQGRLTNANGAPLSDGSYQVVFKLFDAQTGGNLKWQEASQVAAQKGVFSTTLGRTQPFSTNLFSQRLWLEVTVEGRTLAPRQELAAVAYALVAQIAQGLPEGGLSTSMIADGAVTERKLAAGLAIPIGGVIPWYGSAASAPAGWKVCDGSVVSDAASPLNGHSTPDLINRVPRGTAGSVLGNIPYGGSDSHTLTIAQMPVHSHGVSDPGHRHSVSSTYNANSSGDIPFTRNQGDGNTTFTNNAPTGISIQSAGGGQSFPIVPSYVGLVYIMRIR